MSASNSNCFDPTFFYFWPNFIKSQSIANFSDMLKYMGRVDIKLSSDFRSFNFHCSKRPEVLLALLKN